MIVISFRWKKKKLARLSKTKNRIKKKRKNYGMNTSNRYVVTKTAIWEKTKTGANPAMIEKYYAPATPIDQ